LWYNAQSLASYHNKERGDAGRSRAAPKSHPACLTPQEVPFWVRTSTSLLIQPRILTWLTPSRRRGTGLEEQPKVDTPEEERQGNKPASHVRGRHGLPFSSPQWRCRTQSKRKGKGKIKRIEKD
jgi:hypothetical protein